MTTEEVQIKRQLLPDARLVFAYFQRSLESCLRLRNSELIFQHFSDVELVKRRRTSLGHKTLIIGCNPNRIGNEIKLYYSRRNVYSSQLLFPFSIFRSFFQSEREWFNLKPFIGFFVGFFISFIRFSLKLS